MKWRMVGCGHLVNNRDKPCTLCLRNRRIGDAVRAAAQRRRQAALACTAAAAPPTSIVEATPQ